MHDSHGCTAAVPAAVWARQVETGDTIRTKEGSTDYEAGAYLVFNDPDGRDGYAMSAERFHSLYRPV